MSASEMVGVGNGVIKPLKINELGSSLGSCAAKDKHVSEIFVVLCAFWDSYLMSKFVDKKLKMVLECSIQCIVF